MRSYSLPPGLSAALADRLADTDARSLQPRAERISEQHRAARSSTTVIAAADDALAYALSRMPATYAADSRASSPKACPWGRVGRQSRGAIMKFDSILGTVGNTPVVRINRLAPEGIDLYVKIEAFNPLGSVKDRLALGVIEAAEASGELKPGQTVIEATSGNTGIGLAMVCAAKGYPLVVTMAESFSVERRKLMRFLGAKVVLTPAPLGATGMIDKCRELAAANGWFMSRQFENEANPAYHARTTAQEILRDFADGGLDYWVTGFGTGGTLKGVASVLRDKMPGTKIVVGEPETAPMLSSGAEQPRRDDGSPATRHSAWKPHPFQGWSPDFIPKIAGDAVAAQLIDEVLTIPGAEGIRMSQELAQKEGIFVGITAGGTFAAALRVAANARPGSTILCMLPDTGERYLSTPLFADVPADMTEAEQAISLSTPGQQLTPAS